MWGSWADGWVGRVVQWCRIRWRKACFVVIKLVSTVMPWYGLVGVRSGAVETGKDVLRLKC